MTQREDHFPLSARNTTLAIVLSLTCGSLAIITSGLYALLFPNIGFPFQNLIFVSAIGVSAWGLHTRYRWAWRLAAFIAGWQVYFGIGGLIGYFNSEGENSIAVKIMLLLFVVRTIILSALFLLLVLFTERERLYKDKW